MVDIQLPAEATIRDVLERRAAESPGDIYCTSAGREYTIGEIDALVNRVANGLLALGLQPGDRVALMLPSHPDHIVAILALCKAGLVRVPVNSHLIGAALEYPFERFEPHAVIADSQYAAQLEPILARQHAMKVVWRGKDEWQQILQGGDASPPPVTVQPDDILALTPSSGTTGAPKGVVKSDRTIRAGAVAVLRLSQATAGSVFLFWEALHHGAGVTVSIAALLEKIKLVMIDRFSASSFWDQVRSNGVTHIHYLGGVLPILLKQPPNERDRDNGVKIAWGGGCPPDVWQPFSERFGVQMREGYGLSEMTTFVTANVDGPTGSIGLPLSYFDIRLVDDEGRDVPAGTAGEIRIRNRVPGLHFLGYFRDAKASEDSMRDGWFCTGDLAKRDEAGYLYYSGRKKESLRRRGINISAWEVERVIACHANVEECALVAVPSELGDDELKIFIRLKPGVSLQAEDLVAWCRDKLPHFQVPRYVAFIDEFPKTPTLRIRKMELSRATEGVWDAEKATHVA
ncbi:MAG: AMP-binding protein [Ideonella sp.]|nr:AMP-binding protein [Ideonella sp.]